MAEAARRKVTSMPSHFGRSSSSSHSSSGTIRHAGRAHIRGKIRRIWRPRYLELLDNGIVRYYELTSSDNPKDLDWDHVGMIPKCTLLIFHARIIDITTLRDMHVGLPMGTFGFLVHGQRLAQYSSDGVDACHPQDQVTPRDFLCAVGTLEEAQSWVVALQWAASLHIKSAWHDDEDDDLYSTASTLVTSPHPHHHRNARKQTQNAFHVVNTSPGPSPTTTKRKAKAKPGKIVVTKVRSATLVRANSCNLELAYRIQMLLLRTHRQGMMVEERTILRTPQDLKNLWSALQDEITSERPRKILERVQRNQLPSSTSSSYSNFVASLSTVDAVLRTLAMDATICNSQSMRCFWSLVEEPTILTKSTTATTTTVTGRWNGLLQLSLHNPNGVVERRHVATPSNVEDFVKQWLQQDGSSNTSMDHHIMTFLFWLANRPSVIAGVVAVAILIVPPIWFFYERRMALITIRFDVLLMTWVGAALLGKEWERRCSQMNAIQYKGTGQHTPQATREEEELEGDESIVDVQSTTTDEDMDDIGDEETEETSQLSIDHVKQKGMLSSPLPEYPANGGKSCWSRPDDSIFRVRGATYLQDRIKIHSSPAPFYCRGVDIWLTDNPERHISRHPSVLGGKLGEEDTFVVNFLLPFGNFVAYFGIPSLDQFPPRLAQVWTKFLQGDQEYRDARLKLLPVVMDGPWIVRTAVGTGTSPALLGKVIPLQYYFRNPSEDQKGVYEVDVIITASRIAKGILSVVKGHTKMLTIAFAFIIEAAEEAELPETVLCTFQVHAIHLEDCPQLPECNLDEM